MPSAFDLFGPFENSLRNYHKPQWRGRPCPHGIHVPEQCTCDTHHECQRPHCANDVPLDPLCRLTNGMPFGPMVSITDTSSPSHKCHSNGCGPAAATSPTSPTAPTKSPSTCSVVDRLYSTRTHASAAKMRPSCSTARGDAGDDAPSEGKAGGRLISQLIGDQAVSGHDRTRRDGASPSPTRRAQSTGGWRAQASQPAPTELLPMQLNPPRRSASSHAAVKTAKTAKTAARRVKSSESDASSSELSSSPDTSPSSTPATTPAITPVSTPSVTPRKHLSPKNSGNQLLPAKKAAAKKAAKSTPGRPSAVFCGGRGTLRPAPLNKSASDGVERQRNKAAQRAAKARGPPPLRKEQQAGQQEAAEGQLRDRVTRVSSDSRVDELLAQAFMALESLTPEQSGGGAVPHERPTSPSSPQHAHDHLRRLAIAHARKENGKSYKDLTHILQEKMEELDEAMVSVPHRAAPCPRGVKGRGGTGRGGA
ncbi:hypothetical protein E2C01_064957 [Portunus trituberculatus]|uniref:Uncharacterized protein n=1 Tax=Portunus trituberculatus TaxID=210409 RepID=A0A5B7HKL1_PORTR|nr:hypothetical protein [Portunus trituberculatus]